MKSVEKMHEWELALTHRDALKSENYELCARIKTEIDKRIENGTINHALMNGFKSYDAKKEMFVGNAKFEPYNGLFDNYIYK